MYKVPQMGVWLENTGKDRGLTQILGNCMVGSEGRKQMDFFVIRELVKVCFAQSNQQRLTNALLCIRCSMSYCLL